MMGFSLSNPERSVQRNKRPHETWSQICTTRTYTILAISQSLAISPCTSSETAKHELRNALSILTLRNLRSTTPVLHLLHHACDTCRSRQDCQLHVLAQTHKHYISASHTDTQTRTHEFCPGTKVVSKEAQRHCARAPHGAP